ncbi:MAG: type I secretion system permease/ATPase [Beijerinckiaceae bacterium]|jgi:PrtD family type I secretion system ABC transporter|nr:type I secretion system permease/ATPase [Beijerinckiaceae bacterium]
MTPRGRKPASPLTDSLARLRGPLASVGLFSAVVNVLALTGSLYMLQVYDRVLASRSVPTLVAISVLALGLFALQGVLEIVRAKVMSRVGSALERDLLQPVHDLILRLPLMGRNAIEATQPLRDMEGVRAFMSGPGPMAFFDLPWMPLYLLVIYLLHPWLGVLATIGMLVLVVLALLTEHRLAGPSQEATQAAARRSHAAETARRNVELLSAMGFAHRAATRFFTASSRLFAASERLSDTVSTLGALSRITRTILQSAILGLGAYLVLGNQMSPGAIIAASILAGRALAPVEAAIGHWRGFVAARQARRRLEDMLAHLPAEPERIALPERRQKVEVEGIVVAAPGQRQPILRPASLALKAGDGLAVMGPSGAGKSTLARAMVGAWPLLAGAVRIDGAPLEHWSDAARARLIGYLPQDVELFDGTIAENIARLDPAADDAAIVAAAEAANVHELILRLPDGYATMLGEGGHNLSVGQRQRIGLARALYGEPFLVVLDEPNAHLDQDGEVALAAAIAGIRARGGIVVVVSHRSGILEAVNLVAVVIDGELKATGPRDEILAQMLNKPAARPGALRPVPAQETPPGPFRTGMRLTGRMGGLGRRDMPPSGPAGSKGGSSEG